MATPVRSASANALRNNALTVWPGMTIFWIGDLGHQGTVSGHNPDDYPPLRAELTDPDLIPEVRALDFMVGPRFTADDGLRLVNALVRGVDRNRLYYVIYRSTIWRRATGFQPQAYNGSDNHNSHVHTSGHSDDDANGADWSSVLALKEDNVDQAVFDKLLRGALSGTGDDSRAVQALYKALPLQYPVGPNVSLLTLHTTTAANAKAAAEKPASAPAPVDISALVAALIPTIRTIVREELDKTRFSS